MQNIIVCSTCGSAVVMAKSEAGTDQASLRETGVPSHCSNRNCRNSFKDSKPAPNWFQQIN
jgi:hypothetical protein